MSAPETLVAFQLSVVKSDAKQRHKKVEKWLCKNTADGVTVVTLLYSPR